VRGIKVSRAARKEIDLVITAVRYGAESGRLSLAQGFERRGPVWGDVQLFLRDKLVEKIHQGKSVVAGHLADLQGDFEVLGRIQISDQNGNGLLYTSDTPTKRDQLGLPLF
jgi:hypothetical protein